MASILGRLREQVATNGNGSDVEREARPRGEAEHYRRRYVVSAAEAAECTCPEFCERDHEND